MYSQTDSTMRVALQGSDDLVDVTSIGGRWVSDDCEPVVVEFAWEKTVINESASEVDCICPQELASRLIERMLNPCADDEIRLWIAGNGA